MDKEIEDLHRMFKLDEHPAHFKIENKFNIPEVDNFLSGPKFNFKKEKVNIFLSKKYKKVSQMFVDVFENSVGVQEFNKNFYVPLKIFYNKNFDEIFISAQKNSSYDIYLFPDLIQQRLFVEAAFLFMNIEYNCSDKKSLFSDIENKFVVKDKPCIYIFNHPFGIVDTLIAARLTMQKRPDVKFMANSLVGKLIPEIKGLLLDLNVMVDGSGSNNSTVEGAVSYVKQGGAIIMFPDPVLPIRKRWFDSNLHAQQNFNFKRGLGQLILGAPEAVVSMVYLSGSRPNSRAFHGFGRVHPWIKLSMVLREFIKIKGNQSYQVVISKPIDQVKLNLYIEKEKLKIDNKTLLAVDSSKILALRASKYVEKEYLKFKELHEKKARPPI